MARPLTLRVDEPCGERWGDMRPAVGGRHCDRCEKTVVDLSRMTRAQAESVVRARGGTLCVRLATTEAGETLFRAEPRRLPVLGPALAGLLAACTPEVHAEVASVETVAPMVDEPRAIAFGTSSSFAGSLASGVMMPMIETPPPPPPRVASQDGPPTEDQVALTRRKQQHQRIASTVPVLHHTMGVMACPIDP